MRKWWVFLAFGVFVLSLFYLVLSQAFTLKASTDPSLIFFEVKKKESVFEIAKNLKDARIIRSFWAFVIYSQFKSLNLQSGLYYLSKDQNIRQIAQILAQGKIAEYKITVPEGFSSWQIAQLLDDKGILKKDDILDLAKEKEGFLFPDTYRIPVNPTPADIIERMESNFKKRTENLKVSPSDIILASIVEREAKKDEDRSLIAAVFKNRLKKNMFLEADPTVQYAKGTWDPITFADYTAVRSAYNTYLNKGLPPGPICNPGIKSIEAVIKPADTDFLYFFHLKDGTTIYSKTEQEHNQNKKKYSKEIAG